MIHKLAKKLKGYKVKEQPLRTKQEIDIDYGNHAGYVGHKARLIADLQDEIEQHLERMDRIRAEMNHAKQPEVKAEPEAGAV